MTDSPGLEFAARLYTPGCPVGMSDSRMASRYNRASPARLCSSRSLLRTDCVAASRWMVIVNSGKGLGVEVISSPRIARGQVGGQCGGGAAQTPDHFAKN